MSEDEMCFFFGAVFYKDVLFAGRATGCGCLKIFEKFDEAGRLIQLCTYLYLYGQFINL